MSNVILDQYLIHNEIPESVLKNSFTCSIKIVLLLFLQGNIYLFPKVVLSIGIKLLYILEFSFTIL